MLNYKKVDDDKLSSQFGLDETAFSDTAKLWLKVQEIIDDNMIEGMSLTEEGISYDTRLSIDIFFKYFNTQELQDIALIQFLMKELNDRGSVIAMAVGKEYARRTSSNEDNTTETKLEDLF